MALISFLINNKGFLIFQETKPFHISGNVSLKRVLIFKEITFRGRRKNVLNFGKWHFLDLRLKMIFLYFKRERATPEKKSKQKQTPSEEISYTSQKKLFSHFVMATN